MPRPWSLPEIEAVVADYFEMLALELAGKPFNKAERNRALQRLTGRSHGSIEMKHQNISAILRDVGGTYVDGYKPLSNYQDALYDAVLERSGGLPSVVAAASRVADTVPRLPSVADILARLVSPPKSAKSSTKPSIVAEERRRFHSAPVDYVAREARNVALGARGEEWALAFERARLTAEGKGNLADKVEQVSASVGPSAGFDIHSYERDGSDRFIEVKTTNGPIEVGFFVSAREVEVSQAHERRYHLYRPFQFIKDARLFIVPGRLDRTCRLQADQFRAQVA